jgi:hypothetical protein
MVGGDGFISQVGSLSLAANHGYVFTALHPVDRVYGDHRNIGWSVVVLQPFRYEVRAQMMGFTVLFMRGSCGFATRRFTCGP